MPFPVRSPSAGQGPERCGGLAGCARTRRREASGPRTQPANPPAPAKRRTRDTPALDWASPAARSPGGTARTQTPRARRGWGQEPLPRHLLLPGRSAERPQPPRPAPGPGAAEASAAAPSPAPPARATAPPPRGKGTYERAPLRACVMPP